MGRMYYTSCMSLENQNNIKNFSISRADVDSFMARTKDVKALNSPEFKSRIQQAENEARFAGIELDQSNSQNMDPRVALYAVMRADPKFDSLKDDKLFAEVVRMLGNTKAEQPKAA